MISVTLTEEELRKHDACTDGMALFFDIAENGRVHVPDWGPLHTLWLAAAYPGFAAWLSGEGLIPRANLYGANLRSANLRSANLDGANLDGANLRSANLDGANLRSANLDGANLRSANLRSANLRSANLRSANLRSANLDGANLDGANLDGANLDGANLDGAFMGAGRAAPSGWRTSATGYLERAEAATNSPCVDCHIPPGVPC